MRWIGKVILIVSVICAVLYGALYFGLCRPLGLTVVGHLSACEVAK